MSKQLSSGGLTKPLSFETAIRKLAGGGHFHACQHDKRIYSCNCKEPERNRLCQTCRSGAERPLWDRDRDPIDCCRQIQNSKQVTAGKTVETYRLAGPGPWFQCQVCFRSNARREQE